MDSKNYQSAQTGIKGKRMRAILTDVQFWVPALILTAGVLLLVSIHGA